MSRLSLVALCLSLATPVFAAPDARALAQVDQLGDDYPLVIVYRPAAWASLYESFRPLLKRLEPFGVGDLSSLSTSDGVLSKTFGLFGVSVPNALIDSTGTVTLGIGRPALVGPPGSSARFATGDIPEFSHAFLLPAAEPSKLAAAVEASLGQHHKKGANGAWRVQGQTLWVSPASGAVRFDIAGTQPAPSKAATRTPAVLAAAEPDVAVGLIARPWLIRPVATQMGVQKGREVLPYVGPDQRAMVSAAMYSAILIGERLLGDDGADFDDHAVTLRGEKGALRITMINDLTPEGAKAVAASKPSSLGVLEVKPKAYIASVSAVLDVGKLIDAARPSDWLEKAGGERKLAQAFAECGWACPAYALLRRPFGTLAGVRSMMVKAVDPAVIQGVQMVLVGGGGTAFAVRVSDRQGILALEDMAQKRGVSSTFRKLGTGGVWLLGVDADAEKVFGQAGVAQSTGMVARVEFQAVGRMLKALAPAVGELFAEYGEARWLTQPADRVVRTEVVVSRLGKVAKLSTTAKGVWIAPKAEAWPSPMVAAPVSAGTRCLEQALSVYHRLFDAVAHVEVKQRDAVLKGGQADAEPHLVCAEKNPATADAAKALRGLLIDMQKRLVP